MRSHHRLRCWHPFGMADRWSWPLSLVSCQTSSSHNSACLLALGFVARRSQTYGYAPSSRLARDQNSLRTFTTDLSDRTLAGRGSSSKDADDANDRYGQPELDHNKALQSLSNRDGLMLTDRDCRCEEKRQEMESVKGRDPKDD